VATFTPTPFTDTVAGTLQRHRQGQHCGDRYPGQRGPVLGHPHQEHRSLHWQGACSTAPRLPSQASSTNETKQFTSPALTNGFVTSLTLDIANARITGTIARMRRGSPVGVIDIGAPKGYSKTDLPAAGLTGAYNLASHRTDRASDPAG